MAIFSLNNLGTVTSPSLPEIQVFKHIDFNHQLKDTFMGEDDKDTSPIEERSIRTTFDVDLAGDKLDNNISSFIVYSGFWQFFEGVNFKTPIGGIFGPGHYKSVQDLGIANDTISSFKCVAFSKKSTSTKK